MPLMAGWGLGRRSWLLPAALLWSCASSVQAPAPVHAVAEAGAIAPEEGGGVLPPDYAARARRAQDRAAQAETAAARDHAERLADVWTRAGHLETQRIAAERERAALSQERSALRQQVLSLRAGQVETRRRQRSLDRGALEQQRVASAFSEFYGAQQERMTGALPAGLRAALGTLYGTLSLWVDGLSERPLAGSSSAALQAARARLDAFGAALTPPDARTRIAMSRAQAAIERVERALGRMSLTGSMVLEQAALRGLTGVRQDGALVVRLLGPEMFERAGGLSPLGQRAVRAMRGLLRVFGHLAPELQVPVAARGTRSSRTLMAALPGLGVSTQPAPGAAFQVRFDP